MKVSVAEALKMTKATVEWRRRLKPGSRVQYLHVPMRDVVTGFYGDRDLIGKSFTIEKIEPCSTYGRDCYEEVGCLGKPIPGGCCSYTEIGQRTGFSLIQPPPKTLIVLPKRR